MSGASRDAVARTALRRELCKFLLDHAGNRALVSCLYGVGEVSEHLGNVELAAAGAALVGDTSHGHGDAVHSHHARLFSDEEFSAVRWKCRLHLASPETIGNVLRGLPEWSITQAVQEYSQRETALQQLNRRPTFILTRDVPIKRKDCACKHFLAWCHQTYGESEASSAVASFKKAHIPYGWFLA